MTERVAAPEDGVVMAVEKGLPYWEWVVSTPPQQDTWMVSEVLLAMQAVLDM